MEYNLVEIWLRWDPARWAAGVLASLFAAALTMATAMVVANLAGYEIWFPLKLMATPVLGSVATEIGWNNQSICSGALVITSICLFWGVIYAHFTGTTSLKALLPMGLVWGAFSWIFLWNLFFQSFKTIRAAQMSSGALFPVCMVYGLGLASVAIFEPLFRTKKRS
jgi:hypothetical protein